MRLIRRYKRIYFLDAIRRMMDDPTDSNCSPMTGETERERNVNSRNTPNELRPGQYGIGQMMAVMVGISVLCAVLAAVLQRLPKEHQTRGALFILLMVFICLAALAFFHIRRARVENQAGLSHYITRAPLTSWFHFFGILSCVGVLLMMVFGLVSVTVDQFMPDAFSFWNFAYLIWMLGAFCGKYLISTFLWKTNPKSVDVRTNGLILGTFMFLPWKHFHGFRWNQYTKKLMLLSEGRFIEWKVPANQREPLEKVLVGFIPKKEGFS